MKRQTRNPFQRLQWRLTFSYTMVTVAALVAVELVIFAALLALLNSDLLVNTLVSAMRDSLIPQARTFLESTPPDLDGLNTWLLLATDGYFVEDQSYLRIVQGLSINVDEDGSSIFILDPDLRLLAQSPRPDDQVVFGQPFDVSMFPQLNSLLPVALGGETDLDQLHLTLPDGSLLMAVPIVGRDSGVLGVAVMTILIPTLGMATLGPIFKAVLFSVVPITLAAGMIGALFGFLTARNLSHRLGTLVHAADAWSQGDFTAVTADQSGDELGQLSLRLIRMAEQLQNLLQTRQELATLEERNRLARDLHDSVKQQVFATTMQISAAQALINTDPAASQRHMAEAAELSRQSQQELAGLIEELRPAALAGNGLVEALKEFAADWSRRTHIQVQVRTQGELPIHFHFEQTLFRVAQEALANVAKHSQAEKVDIDLVWENGCLTLTISDDGQGFDVTVGEQRGLGMQSMRERVEGINGRLVIESNLGKGTRVIASVAGEARTRGLVELLN